MTVAIQKLLDIQAIEGVIVTIDAISKEIIDRYARTLKCTREIGNYRVRTANANPANFTPIKPIARFPCGANPLPICEPQPDTTANVTPPQEVPCYLELLADPTNPLKNLVPQTGIEPVTF